MEQQANASLFTTVAYTSSGPGVSTASVLPSGELLSAFRFWSTRFRHRRPARRNYRPALPDR